MPLYSHPPFRAKDVSEAPLEKFIVPERGITSGDWNAPYGGHVASGPWRPGIYAQNWSGVQYFQTWENLDFAPGYRALVTKSNGLDTVNLLMLRNQAMPLSPAPIAIQQYALSLQQVYQGASSGY